MRDYCDIHASRLVRVGSKREWVPMWLWMNFIFRFGIYEIWPFNWVTYKKCA
jgi:hypothetical protein